MGLDVNKIANAVKQVLANQENSNETVVSPSIQPKKTSGIVKAIGKVSGWAKKVTLGIIMIAFIIGAVGAFLPKEWFDMEGFILFLNEYKTVFSILVASIGLGSAAKTIFTKSEKDGDSSAIETLPPNDGEV